MKLARMNVLAYFLSGYAGVLLYSLRTLLTHGYRLYFADIAVIGVFLLLPIFYIIWMWAAGGRSAAAAVQGADSSGS